MISAITEVYTQAIASFLPTPSKSHYVFNLRDFARVVQVRVSQFVIHFIFYLLHCSYIRELYQSKTGQVFPR